MRAQTSLTRKSGVVQAKTVVRYGGDTQEKDLLHVGMRAWLLSSPGVPEDKINPSSAKVKEGPGRGPGTMALHSCSRHRGWEILINSEPAPSGGQRASLHDIFSELLRMVALEEWVD